MSSNYANLICILKAIIQLWVWALYIDTDSISVSHNSWWLLGPWFLRSSGPWYLGPWVPGLQGPGSPGTSVYSYPDWKVYCTRNNCDLYLVGQPMYTQLHGLISYLTLQPGCEFLLEPCNQEMICWSDSLTIYRASYFFTCDFAIIVMDAVGLVTPTQSSIP